MCLRENWGWFPVIVIKSMGACETLLACANCSTNAILISIDNISLIICFMGSKKITIYLGYIFSFPIRTKKYVWGHIIQII